MSPAEENIADLCLHIYEAIDRLRYGLVKAEALLSYLPNDECATKKQEPAIYHPRGISVRSGDCRVRVSP